MIVDPSPHPPGGTPRRTSPIPFFILAGVVLAVTALFHRVIRPLALPLFLAALIALRAHPLQVRLKGRLRGRGRASPPGDPGGAPE